MPTPNLGLTPLEAAQSQKHVTVNEAFTRIDGAVQLSVRDRKRTSPPASPQDGDRHLVAAPAEGAWLMQEGRVAAWDQGAQGWLFLTPRDGWRLWIEDEGLFAVYENAQWTVLGGTQLGVNAEPDATNRFSVSSDAILFNHAGTGVQAKLNKAAAGDTAALLFQTGFEGRAEIGLTGDDDLHFKTSNDGTAFNEAIRVEADSGHVHLPAGASVEGDRLGPGTHLNLLRDSGRFCTEGAYKSLQAATFAAPSYLSTLNGASIDGYARFISSSATYGGAGAALDPEIVALHELLRPVGWRRFGPEWWAMRITQGSGTGSSASDGSNSYPLALFNATGAMPRAFTTGYYVRTLSGAAFVSQNSTSRFRRWGTDETGNLAAGRVVPADGWVFIERQMSDGLNGYTYAAMEVYAQNPGDEVLIALPRFVIGHVTLDPYLPGPLPSDRLFG